MFLRWTIFFLSLYSCVAFAAIQDDRWHPGLGDPTVFGWLTVFVYLLAAWRCVVRADASKKVGGNFQLWLYLAGLLLFLAVNKQLDLQSWLTEIARDSAKAHSWYEQRRTVQMAFISLLGVGFVLALFGLRLFLANSWRHFKITWFGVTLLCVFILMRAASFHHFDIVISTDILGLKINVLLELSAIALIILGTFIDKKSINLNSSSQVNLSGVVTIQHDGDDVRCPNCGAQPLAKPVDGRLFKCRACNHKYCVELLQA